MGRFSGGWIKAHRSLFNGDYDGYDIVILLWLVANANYADGKSLARSGHQRTIIRRGQILTSVREMAEALGWTNGLIRKRLNNFVKEQILANETTNTGSLITICNYDKYQCIETVEEQTVEQTASKRRANGEQTASNILKKERKKETKKTSSADAAPKPDKPKKESSGAQEVIARYCELFEQKYNVKPKISGQDAGCLSRVAKANGLENGVKIIETYFQIRDPWIEQQAYPASLVEKNLNKITVLMARTQNSAENNYGLKLLTSEDEE